MTEPVLKHLSIISNCINLNDYPHANEQQQTSFPCPRSTYTPGQGNKIYHFNCRPLNACHSHNKDMVTLWTENMAHLVGYIHFSPWQMKITDTKRIPYFSQKNVFCQGTCHQRLFLRHNYSEMEFLWQNKPVEVMIPEELENISSGILNTQATI